MPISELVTILKWQTIPMLNKKELEMRRIEPHLSGTMYIEFLFKLVNCEITLHR